MNERLLAAASARAAGVQQRSHRPQQRRWAEESEGIGSNRASFRSQIDLRAAEGSDSGQLHFSGYASVYERGYEMWDWYGPYTEIVSAGAASDTLARANLDVPLVLAHDSLRRIARTTNGSLTLSEDDNGLLVDAPELDQADADVAYIAPKLRSGLVDEMSFMFRITAGHWSPDYTEYRIDAFDIHRGDVAIVGYGASPHTAGSGLRSVDTEAQRARMRSLLDLAIAAR